MHMSGLVGDTPVQRHASSMVESTADEHLTVDGDANVVVSAEH